jgi:hypothetical protein
MFTVNDTQFGWEEVVAAADIWNEWQLFVESVRQSLACLLHAAETNRMPAQREVKEAVTAFRYAHNLISAEDAQTWLNRWQMTVDEWTNFLRGGLLRQAWAGRMTEILAAHPVSDQQLAEVLKHHAVCADKLDDWSVRLAGHAAIVAESGWFDTGQPPLTGASGSPRDLVFRIETEFERQRQQTITPKLIETRIADHRLDWIHFNCRSLWFAEERIAREASWCVTEDGLTIDDVARQAHTEVQCWAFYLDEIDAAVRPHFMAARPGDWLGPLKMPQPVTEAGFTLFSIIEKMMPAMDDPQIRQRAETAIVRSWTEQAINEQVKWTIS